MFELVKKAASFVNKETGEKVDFLQNYLVYTDEKGVKVSIAVKACFPNDKKILSFIAKEVK